VDGKTVVQYGDYGVSFLAASGKKTPQAAMANATVCTRAACMYAARVAPRSSRISA